MPYAIKHAGTTVIPAQGRGKRRTPFATPEEATAWALSNYRGGSSWEVIPLPLKTSVVTSTTQKNREFYEEIDAKATALFDQLNPNWEREILVSKQECIRRVLGELRGAGRRTPGE